MFKASWWYFI
uniref:Uncharacterized protein n=1 Tax=Anguilla anguilla TaxID=7936 RepID=A0A0E9R8B0_ANGAN